MLDSDMSSRHRGFELQGSNLVLQAGADAGQYKAQVLDIRFGGQYL